MEASLRRLLQGIFFVRGQGYGLGAPSAAGLAAVVGVNQGVKAFQHLPHRHPGVVSGAGHFVQGVTKQVVAHEEHAQELLADLHLAVPDVLQEILRRVGQALHVGKPHGAGHALDGVRRPEGFPHRHKVPRRGVQLQEGAVEGLQDLQSLV
ncbi:MAG: hypothetical protein BWY88_01008 [Synergistetes bacterium ADurb.Bin520]|nr:MAG: hypothetical protein BWY88_01008 [Synergistetes bacterium ADurb.Bin520]